MALVNSALIAGIYFLSHCIVEGEIAGSGELIKAGIGAGLALLIQLKAVVADYRNNGAEKAARPQKPNEKEPPRILGLI